jgi:hypothetical protein
MTFTMAVVSVLALVLLTCLPVIICHTRFNFTSVGSLGRQGSVCVFFPTWGKYYFPKISVRKWNFVGRFARQWSRLNDHSCWTAWPAVFRLRSTSIPITRRTHLLHCANKANNSASKIVYGSSPSCCYTTHLCPIACSMQSLVIDCYIMYHSRLRRCTRQPRPCYTPAQGLACLLKPSVHRAATHADTRRWALPVSCG